MQAHHEVQIETDASKLPTYNRAKFEHEQEQESLV